MVVKDNYSLREHNTFGIEAKASRFFEYTSVDELQKFVRERAASGDESPLLHIGGGSNLLFLNDFDGTVLHSRIDTITVVYDSDDTLIVRVGAGILWDAWVQYAVDHRWYGLENLSLIPGEVGASAVQNIGAYGSEAKDFIVDVEAVNLQTGEATHFSNEDCKYGYRDSAFKHDLKGLYAVTHVHFRLSHVFCPHIDYGGIRKALAERAINESELSAQQLRQVIIEIRKSKLPEPSELGNAGSFFTNPIVAREVFEAIFRRYPTMPHFDIDDEHVKIPAGWMIEQCGWKGKDLGRAGVYEKQALVLVNRGGATGNDIKTLCEHIQSDVKAEFGIEIVPEVNFIC